MNLQEVERVATSLIRKYDWKAADFGGQGIKLTVNDGEKYVSVYITTGESAEAEIKRAIRAVDNHEYGELEG